MEYIVDEILGVISSLHLVYLDKIIRYTTFVCCVFARLRGHQEFGHAATQLPLFSFKRRHVREKHVLIGRKHDMLGNQTFEVLQPSSKLSHQSWKVFEFVDMFSINKYGRNFKPGISLSEDFRNRVFQMAATRPVSEICERYRINRSTVHKHTTSGTSTSKIWKSCSHQYFIVTLDDNPHLRKEEAYFNRSE